jgi:hemerythrin superfamily protein
MSARNLQYSPHRRTGAKERWKYMPDAIQDREASTATPSKFTPSFRGSSGVFGQLIADHREVAALFEGLFAAKGLEKRRALWLQASAMLISHERAEQQEVYEVFRAYSPLQGIVEEHSHQTPLIETLVTELDELPMSSPDWLLTLQRLVTTVNQHVEEEETDFFPKAYAALGRDRAERMDAPYLTARRSLLRTL